MTHDTPCPNACKNGYLGHHTHRIVRCFSRDCPHAGNPRQAESIWGRA